MLRLCTVAMIGIVLTACGGKHDGDNQATPTDTITAAPAAKPTEEPKEHEHHAKHEEPTEHKDTVVAEKGKPKVDTVAPVKPKEESTMGSAPTKHHVRPGGVQGTK